MGWFVGLVCAVGWMVICGFEVLSFGFGISALGRIVLNEYGVGLDGLLVFVALGYWFGVGVGLAIELLCWFVGWWFWDVSCVWW